MIATGIFHESRGALMDHDTAVAVDSLASRIGALETSLHSRIDRVESSVRSDIDRLRIETRGGFEERGRPTQVLFESLSDDIRLLADGFAHLSARVERFFK